LGIVGCGGSGSQNTTTNNATTPKGTYQVTVTGTASATTHTTVYSLTVQ
jgi:hypothetical protein